MGNHYHLLVETPEGNLVEGKKRESHSGEARGAHGEAAARKPLMAGLRVLGMEAGEIGKIETTAVLQTEELTNERSE